MVPPCWPELSDFIYRLGEILELASRAMLMGISSLVTETENKNAKELMIEAADAFKECFEMRVVAFGSSHSKTIEAQEQSERLLLEIESEFI